MTAVTRAAEEGRSMATIIEHEALADGLEFRGVMDESGVNHAIRGGGSTPQAVQILKITPMNLGTSGDNGTWRKHPSERGRALDGPRGLAPEQWHCG
jgi:hypothetical protein